MQRRWGWPDDDVCDDVDDDITVVDWRNSGMPVEVKSKSRGAAAPAPPSPPCLSNEWTAPRRQVYKPASAYPCSSHRSTYNTRSRSVTPSYDEYDYSNYSERPSVESAQSSSNTKRLTHNDTWFNDIEEIDYSVGASGDNILKTPSPLTPDIKESGSKTTESTQPQIPLLQVPQPSLPLEDLMADMNTKSKPETAGKGVKRKRTENGTAVEDSIEGFLSKARNRTCTSARNYAKPSKNKVVLGKTESESTDVSGETKNVPSSPSREGDEIISSNTQPNTSCPLPENEIAEEGEKGFDDSMDSDPTIENAIIKIRTDIFDEDVEVDD